MSMLRNTARIEQTKGESDRLWKEIEDWTRERQRKDIYQRHVTQLETLQTALIMAVEVLRCHLDGLSPNQNIGTVYRWCQEFDQRLLWVRRAWSYFQSKFEQFDGPQGRLLSAANEVIWSCYAGIVKQVQHQDPTLRIGSAPLPYVESLFSPRAILRSSLPTDLQSKEESNLISDFLRELPIPLISLPPVCVQAPWWLVFLGHEVGHQVQFDLLPGKQLVEDFANRLDRTARGDQAVEANPGSTSEWYQWGVEIFADVFSILSMGPWAIWAMTELEMGDDLSMLDRRDTYPPAVVRLALMAQVGQELGVDGRAALHGLQPEALVKGPGKSGERAKQNLKQIPEVAKAITKYRIGNFGELKDLVGWNKDEFSGKKPVYYMKQALRGKQSPVPDTSLSGAKLCVSAAVAAWTEVFEITDNKQRRVEQKELAENILNLLPECREPGKRAVTLKPEQNPAAAGEKLARLLIAKSEKELWG